ncbi:MAG: rhomboid family intramembrane serine protease [Edaphobacter sp.]|uniref:rhomboid family intramembrane serine protease n=1 Tax=Edaphobacter sp. TaxID=1934404 RepID=UPI0023942446|nr:rhomboid family intramembrane serine protease [Edaphobacter sp.]MDE1176904.1 rhomboid family intramembrane serine protease [Edaphobacter sp.]
MPRSGPISLNLPSFGGAVRRLILINVVAFFALALISWVSPGFDRLLMPHMVLEPLAVMHGEVWQLATYSLVNPGILSMVFAMLTLWFTGSLLESSHGGRWLMELYWTSVIGGAAVATAVSFTHVFGLRPDVASVGAWAGIFGLLMAIAMLFGDQEFLLWFVLRLKAKYMVAIYILIAVAVLLKQADSFGALLQLSGALAGFLFVKFAPRRGFAFGMTESFYGVRNSYYRYKRRRAARKFEVYMRKQNREVHFDEDGRYIDPDELKRDPNDRRWMN